MEGALSTKERSFEVVRTGGRKKDDLRWIDRLEEMDAALSADEVQGMNFWKKLFAGMGFVCGFRVFEAMSLAYHYSSRRLRLR